MSSEASQLETIKFGDETHTIDVSKIPYLSSFVRFERSAHPDSEELTHSPIRHLDVVLKGITSGYRQCFRDLPSSLDCFQSVCQTYELFCIDILQGQNIRELISDLKAGKYDYDYDYKGDKSKARDAAFRLLYLILLGEFTDENKDAAQVYNAVLFVVSHSGTFKWRTRTIVRAAYEERFDVSEKQKRGLDKWVKKDDSGVPLNLEDESDATTEEDEDIYYGSDFSI
ncbi:hypothetical protein HYFRA_00011092 [Hymenoscyphus fraxineus]|uniref:Uncharacterized protein n=1 Tax=Hymenoscyphus fraxineus TaxID=746836 RepID=A0A9N9PWK9_9HELO|nr:hypothetical protein HYFRA_00011092 [Hymenoscyphus fraxineus]